LYHNRAAIILFYLLFTRYGLSRDTQFSTMLWISFYQEANEMPRTCVYSSMQLSSGDINRVIEMAWEDRTSFDTIKLQFGLVEKEVINLMRREMKPSSFRMWRKRVQGRSTKHNKLRGWVEGRHKCSLQRTITNNKISKRA
jgi:uncharacterized protein (TIGR03643 family)